MFGLPSIKRIWYWLFRLRLSTYGAQELLSAGRANRRSTAKGKVKRYLLNYLTTKELKLEELKL